MPLRTFASTSPFKDTRPVEHDVDGAPFAPLVLDDENAAGPQIILALNWFEELERLVPTEN